MEAQGTQRALPGGPGPHVWTAWTAKLEKPQKRHSLLHHFPSQNLSKNCPKTYLNLSNYQSKQIYNFSIHFHWFCNVLYWLFQAVFHWIPKLRENPAPYDLIENFRMDRRSGLSHFVKNNYPDLLKTGPNINISFQWFFNDFGRLQGLILGGQERARKALKARPKKVWKIEGAPKAWNFQNAPGRVCPTIRGRLHWETHPRL